MEPREHARNNFDLLFERDNFFLSRHFEYLIIITVAFRSRAEQFPEFKSRPLAQNKTHRRSTQPKKRNRCHAMTCHQNADAMVLASALLRGIPPGRLPF
jgi:hypothetical protein